MMRMILLITNKDDITVDFIIQRLKACGYTYYRLNTEDIPNPIGIYFSANECIYQLYDKRKDQVIDLSMVSSVYFRRPKISSLEYMKPEDNQRLTYSTYQILLIKNACI